MTYIARDKTENKDAVIKTFTEGKITEKELNIFMGMIGADEDNEYR